MEMLKPHHILAVFATRVATSLPDLAVFATQNAQRHGADPSNPA